MSARNAALQEFWKTLRRPVPLAPLVASPLGRHYRTVSKRKVYHDRHGELHLSLIDPTEREHGGALDVQACAIEPVEHAAIYAHIQDACQKPYAHKLADDLRYVVIKGNLREFSVILSVGGITGEIVKATNTLSRGLSHKRPDVKGLTLYEDRGDGRYYLGTRDPSRRGSVRKIFGDGEVYQKFGGQAFLFSPLAFTQANASLVDRMIEEAGKALESRREHTLFDLYCGYGLFALAVGRDAKKIVGIERSPESIDAAQANARRQHVSHARFIRCDITPDGLEAPLERMSPDDVVILDPPRSGAVEGVIETIAMRRPQRAVHFVCNIDLLDAELRRWEKSGYRLAAAVPFDMFPGTDEVEIMIVVERSN
jgi:tRNA/tmRNA/rRNA uracil-C5-methylase (TrmA/RlmC/RlmD family)